MSEVDHSGEDSKNIKLESANLTFSQLELFWFDCGRITVHHGFLAKKPVRVVCIESKPPDNEEDLSAHNFQVFLNSLTRIDNICKCVGVWSLKKNNEIMGYDRVWNVECFVFEQNYSMNLDKLLKEKKATSQQIKRLMGDILVVVDEVSNMGFAIPKLYMTDILIIETPSEVEYRYRLKLTGMESWKFFGDHSNLLTGSGSYDQKSKSKVIHYQHTKIALDKIFHTIDKNLNLDEEDKVLYKDFSSRSILIASDLSLLRLHPYFWEIYKRFKFFEDVYHWIAYRSNVWEDINTQDTSQLYDDNDWHTKLEPNVLGIIENGFLKDGMEAYKFPGTTRKVGYLIRAVRHSYEHIQENSINSPYYVSQSTLYTYFSGVFPSLLLFVYKYVFSYTPKDPYLKKKYICCV
ncbi:hypothetical protein CASFOL_006698 [Castilleja foliolosa]|uniref:KEN domain-containing protein n=1 Tax=Castilleja foliolosa TaxID=1961234 RepID=A0ABD3E739_9LAMI